MFDDEEIDTSYEPFSREPEYIEANRAFIQTLGIRPETQIVDLACGTSTMTDLMLESAYSPGGWTADKPDIADLGERLKVVGLDLSRESLLLGRTHLEGLGILKAKGSLDGDDVPFVSLLEASADRIPLNDECADLVIMGNAIQLVEDRQGMFSEINRILRPGGRFCFNTSFYAGTYCEGTEHVYVRWMQEAVAYLRKRNNELKAAGEPGIKRKRGTAAKAFSNPWLSIEQYASEMKEHGLETQVSNERTVMLDQRCFETIGAYAGLAKVLLSGYPVKLASEALERSCGAMLEAVGMEVVPRYWLEMVSRKAS